MSFQNISVNHIARRFVISDWGGIETAILNLCRKSLVHNDEVKILSTLALKKDKKKSDSIKGIGIQYYNFFYPVFPLSKKNKAILDCKGGDPISWTLCLDLLHQHQDVIHCHTMNRLAFFSYVVSRIKKIPFIITLHGGYHHIPDDEMHDLSLVYKQTFHWGRIIDLIFRSKTLLERADCIICVGYDEYHTCKSVYTNTQIEYIPNGVCTETFNKVITSVDIRDYLDIRADKKILLNVGRIDSQKGQLRIIHALRLMDEDYCLVLCGPITQQKYYATLLETINTHRLGHRVFILSDIKPESELLYALYQQADIFMMSSIHEPFGIVVLEAWASGLPVISSFVGGLKNLIKDGETGLFTDYSNPNAIKESIEKLNNQPSLYRDIVKKSAITVAEQYSWSTVYQQTRDIYLQQIQRKKF